ncbi:MAG TPA: phosphoribosylglycinamide formyltransferase, partial [Chitinophagaceae bacterium]|nr:phosphoribosylglycinamide formyltransferase [Chitinophagaceae bacterium]
VSNKSFKAVLQKNIFYPTVKNTKHRIAIFASGAGSNAKKIIEYFRSSNKITVALIVCNKPDAGVLKIAEEHQIPAILIEKKKFFEGNHYIDELKNAGITFIVLAGFLWKLPAALIKAYQNKIINIHPALLPGYGGKGMYGRYVHEAVINAAEKESGITIHYVDEHYDHGQHIFQVTCHVFPGDTPEKLAQRIHLLEYEYYPKVIEEVILKPEEE